MYDLKKKTSPFIPISIYLNTFGFTPSGSSSFNTGICDLRFDFFCFFAAERWKLSVMFVMGSCCMM